MEIFNDIIESLKINIDPDFKNILPPQTKEENINLEVSILRDGIREPIVLWLNEKSQYYLVDGHHRLEIANKHNIEYKVNFLDLKNKAEVLEWIIQNQQGRRSINKATRQYMMGKAYNLMAEKTDKSKNFKAEGAGSTAQKIGIQFGISESTAKNYAEYAKVIDGFNSDFKNNIILKFDETRIEILKEMQSELYTKKINENNFLYFVAEIETRLKNQKQENEIYKPKPKITENKIFEKTSPAKANTKGQNLTFGEPEPKGKQIENKTITESSKEYTPDEIQNLKIKFDFFKNLCEEKEKEIEELKKEIKNCTGSRRQTKQKFQKLFKKGFEIYIREGANILKARKDENDERGSWEVINYKGLYTEENAIKHRDELLENENVIFLLF